MLRILRATALPAYDPPRVVGLDDFAFQKRRRYGTLIVDLERHRPIDLLADRSATTVSAWLQRHPEIVVVARDRAPDYRRGTTEGAPMATQVADRFHLVCNLREAVERALHRRMVDFRALMRAQPSPEQFSIPQNVGEQPPIRYARQPGRHKIQAARQATRQAQHAEAQRLRTMGLTQRQIAQRLGRCCQTIQRWLRMEQARPERRGYRGAAKIDAYVGYLHQRLAEGCINQTQLWREICAQGFTGSRSLVSKWTRTQPDHREQQPSQITLLSAKELSWMVVRPASDHTADETVVWERFSAHPDLAVLTAVAQEFLTMLRERQEGRLEAWIITSHTSGIAEIRQFAEGIQRDGAAVRAALQLPWSTGPVEGQINRLKWIKRSGYGRMKLDLLRVRVLATA